MEIKVLIDIKEDARDLIPSVYIPGDVIVYRCNTDFISVEKFISLVKEDFEKGVWNVYEKKSSTEER